MGSGSRLRDGMVSLPPHPDVRSGLERLGAAGYRLAALTNSTLEVADRQLTGAGLHELFEAELATALGG